MKTSAETQWLVRKTSSAGVGSPFIIYGPYATDQVRNMITQGLLDADDEVCPENSFWFALYESNEVRTFLGLEGIIKKRAGDDEVTQPDMETTAPDLTLHEPTDAPDSSAMHSQQRGLSGSGSTQASSRNQARTPVYVPNPMTNPKDPLPINPPPQGLRMENSSYMGLVLLVGIVAVIMGVLWVLRRLKA